MTAPVCVLMPVYNAERYLAQAVESILAQTFRDFEFLIIDDGSTDNSLNLLKRYAADDSRIRLISRPNTGIVGVLNEGLERTSCELIARMDSDDIALPERLERQVNYLRANSDCVALGSRVLVIDPDGDPLRVWGSEQSHDEIEAALLDLNKNAPMTHSSIMYRRSAVLEVGKYRERAVEDIDLWLRLGERGRLANLPDVLIKYRHHPGSLCHDGHLDRIPRSINLSVTEAYQRRGLKTEVIPKAEPLPRLSMAETHTKWAWWALASGHVATARKHALKRLRMEPGSIDAWRLLYCSLRGH